MRGKKRVVVIGAGFGGLQAIQKLSVDPGLEVVVIDKKNHHLFQPLLYQVATAVLSPADIAIPIRALVGKKKNVRVILGEVTKIDPKERLVYYQNRSMEYDYLVVAAGAQASYFGHDEWAQFTIGLKNIKEALQLRQRLLLSFEEAELEGEDERVAPLLHQVIIGGGPTGVELAGSIAELAHQIMKNEFKRVDPELCKITLIEAGPRLLHQFDPSLSEYTQRCLEERGVRILTGSPVVKIDHQGVHTKDGVVKSRNIFWAAGVRANDVVQSLGVELDRGGRVIVNEFCQAEPFENVFVIGDIANFQKGLEHPLPGVSPVAMQQGRFVGDWIRKDLAGKEKKPFIYTDKGSMATIGRKAAVAQMGKLKLKGVIGWLAWLFVHLFYQVGFKNKTSILITWIWSYLTFKAEARLIQDEIHADKGTKIVKRLPKKSGGKKKAPKSLKKSKGK